MNKLLLAFALLFALNGTAQTVFQGAITGTLQDSERKPIDAATVTLHRASDSVFVKAALSDETGRFEFDNMREGDYFIRASHLLFQPFTGPAFRLDAANTPVRLTDCQLNTKDNSLGEVNVSAKKQFVERQLDKLVVNVENSIVAAGNSALEVLERSPGVLVNQESGLNLKGKSGVIVMIDGKPSPLSGSDLITYLRGIPASNIQIIEIITNPSNSITITTTPSITLSNTITPSVTPTITSSPTSSLTFTLSPTNKLL